MTIAILILLLLAAAVVVHETFPGSFLGGLRASFASFDRNDLTMIASPGGWAVRIIAVVILLLIVQAAHATEIPRLTGRVNDYARVLSGSSRNAIEERLATLEAANPDKAQIAVLLPVSLEGESVEQYANTVFRAWGLGQKTKDNGVLLVIAPNERKIRMEVGYGVEPLLPDSKALAIIDSDIKPNLRRGREDYAAAINAAITTINATIMEPAQEPAPKKEHSGGGIIYLILFSGCLALLIWAFTRRSEDSDEDASLVLATSAASMAARGKMASASATGAAAMASRPTAPKPKRRDEGSHLAAAAVGAAIGSSLSSSSSSSSSSSDSGSSFSGGGGDSGGGGASSDF
jgi:uncharacterized protein